MEQTIQIILACIILVIAFILSRRILAYKMVKAYNSIMNELKEKGAYSPESAAELRGMNRYPLRFGLKDYRPKVLQQLIIQDIIGMNEEGAYFIKQKRDEQ